MHRIAVCIVAALWSAVIPTYVFGQPGTEDPVLPDELERGLEGSASTDESLDERSFDQLEQYRSHPLILSRCSVSELAALPGISPQIAARILEFMRDHAPKEIDRLEDLESITPDILAVLRMYTIPVESAAASESPEFHLQIRSRLRSELQRRRGFRESLYRIRTARNPVTGDSLGRDTISLGPRFPGSPLSGMTRVLLDYGNVSAGITIDHDPGEQFFYADTLGYSYRNYERVDSPVAPDVRHGIGMFLGYHARIDLEPATVLLGNYTAGYGQGLLFGNRFSGRKGGHATRDPYPGNKRIRPYRSAGESGYLNGIGVALHPGAWLPDALSIDAFVSNRALDASIETEAIGDGDTLRYVRSFQEDGLLRTATDIRRDDAVTGQLAGTHVHGEWKNASIGITGYVERYSLPLESASGDSAALTHIGGVSLSGDFGIGSHRVFGEVATDGSGERAGILGIALSHDAADFTLSGRWYGREYSAPHATAFGESPSDPSNELGLYLGLRSRIDRGLYLSMYGDLYRIPAGTSSIPFPITGLDGMAALEFSPLPALDVRLRIRSEHRDDAETSEDDDGRRLTAATDRTISSARVDALWRPRRSQLQASVRVERKWATYSGSTPEATGALGYLHLRWQPLHNFSLAARATLFRAGSSDTRLYSFEHDVPGSVSIPGLSGEGRRVFALIAWKPFQDLLFSARYSETWYADRNRISPGSLDEIAGSVNNRVTLQVDWELRSAE